MTIYYLMVKTHNITGLKYLCQPSKQDPYSYLGSGIEWTNHLKQYGRTIRTEVLLETTDKQLLNNTGRYYSTYYKITTAVDNYGNRIWANAIPETGGGPGITPENSRKLFASGNHPFQNKELARKRVKKQISEGTHNFLGGSIQRGVNKKRVENGTHHFLSGQHSSKYQKEIVNRKEHLFQNITWQKEQQLKLVEAGTHHLLGPNSPTQHEWICEVCGKLGKGKSNFARWHSH